MDEVDGYRATMAEQFTDIIHHQDPSTRNMTSVYEKLLNSDENNDNSNENDTELRIFIENPSEIYYFSTDITPKCVCDDV